MSGSKSESSQSEFEDLYITAGIHNIVFGYIILYVFIFPICFVSAAGQNNVIWTGTGLPRFRFGSGTVPALLF